MSQIVKLRRSSVPGQKPTNSNLQLGELALNTSDGKVYMSKSGSLGPSVEELISTNTVNTGSVNISGSFNLEGNQSITGSLLIGTGSFHPNNPEILHVQNSGSINIAHFQANNESYVQINVKNTNSGTGSSGDIVVTADNGNEGIHYVDMGINSSTYNAGYVGYANDAYLINAGKDLYVGTLGGINHPSNVKLFAQNNWENPQIEISGSKQISFNTGSVSSGYTYEFSGSIKADHNLNVVGHVTANQFTGSALGLTNVPFHITGSDVEGNTYNKQFTKLQFDDSTGLNVSESVPGTAFISIGSHFKDIFVSGSPILSATGSDAFEIIPLGGIQVTTSITDTNANGYVKELTISTTNLSSSINNRIDIITGSLDGIINSFEIFSGSLETFTSSVVLTSQTSSMNVLSASYALTAAFALNAGAGGTGGGAAIGSYNSLIVTSAASTWSFQHNTGQKYPIFQVFDNNGYVVIPSQIRAIDDDNAEIIFPSAQTGRVIASLGGGNGTTLPFTSSSLWTVNHNLNTDYPDVTIWDSNRNIIFPNRIESVNSNQVKIYFSQAISGHVSLSRGGHIVSGSGAIGLSDITWVNLLNKPSGLVSGSSQLTGSYDTRYVLSGSITQTTWDNIANKPSGLISGSVQVELTGTTGYSTFSSSISSSIGSLSSSVATTTSGLTSTITTLSSSLSGSIDSLSSSVASINNTQNGRLDSLETASGSIRTDFNSFTSSYTTVSGSLDSRLDVLEAYSGSQLVPSSSMSFRTLETSVYCKNITGVQINKGTVVRIVGSVGDNPLIAPASLLTEGSSANTLGIATQNIPNDDFGMVITEGILIGVNTSGMTAGDLLYLGANGTFTTSPPAAPNHGVRLGEVLRVQQNQGSIYVRVDNGIELNEAHDVIYSSISHGDLLIRSGSVWKNSKSLEGSYVVTGSLTITQNLTVLGSSSITYVTSSQLQVATSTISVNVFEPAERFGGLKVYDSGSSSATASLLWDSLHNHWVYQNVSGSNYSGGMLIAGPRNTGSLGDEPNLINGRIVKSVGGDHIDNSIISETGTTITIAGDLVANSITGAFDYFGLVNRPTLVSGSSQINYSGLTGIPSGIVSGSEQLTGSYDTRYVLSGSITQTTWDNIASKPNDIVSSSNQISAFGFLETGSFNTYTSSNDGRVSSLESFTASLNTNYVSETEFGTYTGSINTFTSSLNTYTSSNDGRVSSLESKTGSYATTGSNSFIGTENVTGSLIVSNSLNVIGFQNVTGSLIVSNSLKVIGTQNINGNLSVTGSVVISGSLDISNANVDNSRYLHTQGSASTTWTIVHNLNYNYPNIIVYDASNKVMLPDEITSIDANTTQVTFAVAESGHALASVGGISTSTADRYLHTQTSATGSWVIDHNIGYKYVTVNVYDGSDEQLIPQKITAVSVNRTQIDFTTPTSGNAIITVGGPRSTSIFNQSGSFYNTNFNIGITGSLVVTGDVDADNFNTTSDKKLKTNLVRIENALDKIEKLNGYTFNWLEEYSEDRTRQIGMVADEVYEVQPELISHRDIVLLNKEEKIKLLDYSKVTALLIEAIKELNDKVTKLENKKKKK
jgi:trimeric autotransporter adhesin